MTLPTRRRPTPATETMHASVSTSNNRRSNAPKQPQNGPVAPVYDTSHGYPKGLPEGPETVVTVKGKKTIIHGVPWEELDKETQEDLDKNPLDESGNLRIFIEDSFFKRAYIELGSEARAMQFRNHLHDMGSKLL